MDNYDWTLGLNYGENSLEFRWREHHGPHGQPMGHYGFVYDASAPDESDAREYPFQVEDEWIRVAVRSAASNFRRSELRREIDSNSFEWIRGEEIQKDKILELFERSESGEYLGQSTNNQNLYVQDLAAIFEFSTGQTLRLVDALIEEEKLGLSGMILVSYESYADGFRYWEEQTGHRKLLVGDWGPWACHACGRSGDEYQDPAEYPCVSPAEAATA